MLEIYEDRLKALEDKINEITFVLSSNELYMKVPVSPLEAKVPMPQKKPEEPVVKKEDDDDEEEQPDDDETEEDEEEESEAVAE